MFPPKNDQKSKKIKKFQEKYNLKKITLIAFAMEDKKKFLAVLKI